MDLNIKSLLNDWVIALPPKEYPHISPSSLGGCPRSHYWKLQGVKETTPPNPGALLNFQIGFLWEKVWEEALKWKGVTFHSQVFLEDKDLNLAGTCDFLVQTDVDKNEWEIWDSKTQGSKWFWYVESQVKRGTYDARKEEFAYILQQAAYIWLARKAGYNVTKAKLAYISKDDGLVGRITEVVLDEGLEEVLLNRVDYLNNCLETNTLPECECEGWKVGYCGYGNPNSRERNRTGKLVNSECCSTNFVIKQERIAV